MLQITPTPSVRQPQRHTFITAQALAKGRFLKQERADLAARYTVGLLTIQDPTDTHAASIFDTSPTSIKKARARLDVRAAPAIDTEWHRSLYRDREQFVRDHADEILKLLDRITAPAGPMTSAA
jgi:hypothetical protein